MKLLALVINKIHTIGWFLVRPSLYSQMIYLFYQRLFPDVREDTREEATVWCKKNAVTSLEALKEIIGEGNIEEFKNLFKEFYLNAEAKIQSINMQMGGGADLDLLYHLAEFTKAKTVVETGVAYGWSSTALLFSLANRNGVLYSTDMPYPKMNNEKFVGYIIPDKLRAYWKLYRLPDRQAIKKIFSEVKTIDMCHYDSDKSYRGRKWAYPLFWSKLRRGGMFISDDINDNLAFEEFSKSLNLTPKVIYLESENKYIGLLEKP